LLIGVLARTDEQLIIFAMVPLFVLSALREAWIPLEEQSETFQAIGHVLPSVWAMDGLKNIVIRDIGLSGALQPAGIVPACAAALFALAVWRFGTE
jgi:ABC-type multidrug transport system permease subunit